ncbi:uncharacterized protein [Prorops nasuta]|uniref:uncharacterized protein isoform X2 n=1 Tax=Prorops nasuta TaxID=863751 RepID=UPI0034CECAB6
MFAMRRFLISIVIWYIVATATCINCQDTGWEKVQGMKPESFKVGKVLHEWVNSEGIVAPCFEGCKRNNCTSFLIDFEINKCFTLVVGSDEFTPEPNATFYHKICIKVPEFCVKTRFWQVERTLGAILIDSNTTWYQEALLRSDCYESCIADGDRCKSAQFKTSKALSIGNNLGKCAKLGVERGTRPQGYRVSMYREEYLQTQCHTISKQDYCSYAEYRNMTLPYSDVAIYNLTAKQCENRCDLSEDGFICKAYTINSTSSDRTICLLHSEDTTSLGVSSLVNAPGLLYKEREPCLHVKVQCGKSTMRIELITSEPFEGRIYSNGFSETCGIQGTGQNSTVLTLPLPKKEEAMNSDHILCGLTPAFSIDNENRTHAFVWATVVVQYNPIIQRLGDQAVRVGCSLDENEIPAPKNITVHSGFTFLDPNAGVPRVVSTVINNSTESPVITMRILNEKMEDASVTQLGQTLILKIEIKPVDGPYDIMAGHLVASSETGDASYLLLNEVGCPTDASTFPQLSKDPTDNRSLISEFSAFKFPNSQRVLFRVIVTLCLDECTPTICRGGVVSYGRRRRRRRRRSSEAAEAHEITTTVRTTEVNELYRNNTPDELPLEVSIIVQSPVISAKPLLSKEPSPDTVLLTGGIGYYRRQATRAEEDRAEILARHLYGMHAGNFEISRRVRWADHNSTIS